MTATLHQLGTGSGAGRYYTHDAAREAKPRNRDEYYTREGGGIWWSTGETIVEHNAPISTTTFEMLCAGYDPRTGNALVRGAGEGHRAGVDLTFTPGKTVALCWMAGTGEQREQIEAAHSRAVDRALHLVVDEGLVQVRHGVGGKHKQRPTDLIVARFEHFTTREGDPNIHTHAVVMNIAGTASQSGRYSTTHLTTEPERLFRWKTTVGAAYRAALAEDLAKLGFTFRSAGRGQWEVAGVSRDLIDAFSKRSRQIEEQVGRDASAMQKQIAALDTRNAKERVPTGAELEARWKAELATVGGDPWQQAFAGQPDHAPDRDVEYSRFGAEPQEIAGATPVAVAASSLFRHETVIDRRRLLEGAFIAAGLKGLGPDTAYAELAARERDGTILALDGEHWTTPAVVAAEATMLGAADRPSERQWFNAAAVVDVLDASSGLSAEQREAVLQVTNNDGVSIIEAGAGTGKTTTAKAIAEAARRSGLDVTGLAPSWTAADELARAIGIEAHATAPWRWKLERDAAPAPTATHLLLVDEAAMLGTRDMAAILDTARKGGAKVILLGDRRQLEAVAGGNALAAIRDVLQRSSTLNEVRRQEVDWQRAATKLMARGDAEAGLRSYARFGHVDLVDGEEAARKWTIEQWRHARRQYGDDVIIVTRRNADAAALNLAARKSLREEHRLDGQDVELPAIGRDGKPASLSLARGDQLRFGETLPQFGIRNGTRATVLAIDMARDQSSGASLRLSLHDGREIEASWSALVRPAPRAQSTHPRVVHAYSGTAHAAQGRTAEAAIVYLARQTDAREIYVALTRHRRDVRVVVEASRLDAACRQHQEDHRVKPTTVAMMEHLFAETRRFREKANVVDFVANRQAFIATGKPTLRLREDQRDPRGAIAAARSLSEVISAKQSHWLIRPWKLARYVVRYSAPVRAMIDGLIYRSLEQHPIKHNLDRD